MSDEADLTMEEKRVYADRAGKREALVAAGVGVVAVDVSDDLVGGFRVEHRCAARDVAVDGARVAVAAEEGVLLAEGDGEFTDAGFGDPAVAVDFRGDAVVAAAEDGTVARLDWERGDAGGWRRLGDAGEVRAIDGGLLASADGVYRIADGELAHAGLSDARDVAGTGVPLAATAAGLYALGNGWIDVLGGEFRVVDGDGERAHAASTETAYARIGGDWRVFDFPAGGAPVEFAYAREAVAAVADDGTFLVDAGDGWRTQALGLREVGGLAVR